MIFDVHQYKCRYGTVQAQVKLYEEKGMAVHQRHLGKPRCSASARPAT